MYKWGAAQQQAFELLNQHHCIKKLEVGDIVFLIIPQFTLVNQNKAKIKSAPSGYRRQSR